MDMISSGTDFAVDAHPISEGAEWKIRLAGLGAFKFQIPPTIFNVV